MIAVDTNVIVRFLTADDKRQAEKARRLIENAAAKGEQVFVGCIALVETLWVLGSVYGFSRGALAEAVMDLLSHTAFVVERREDVEGALERFRKGKADFSDYLLSSTALSHGAGRLHTFDKSCTYRDMFVRM